MDIKVTGVGEFRSFQDEDHRGFLRFETPHGSFDLPVTEQQLVTFMSGVFVDERPLTEAEREYATTIEPSAVRPVTGHESVSSSGDTSAPSFGDDDDFDLEEEEPIQLRPVQSEDEDPTMFGGEGL